MLGDIDDKADHRLRRTARNQAQRRLIQIDAMLECGVLRARDQGRTHAVASRARSCVYGAQAETAAHTASSPRNPRSAPAAADAARTLEPATSASKRRRACGDRRPSCTRANAASTTTSTALATCAN